ncbi:MAG: hypothetical protein ACD_22C00072G0021, partial [uncultured bacterium]
WLMAFFWFSLSCVFAFEGMGELYRFLQQWVLVVKSWDQSKPYRLISPIGIFFRRREMENFYPLACIGVVLVFAFFGAFAKLLAQSKTGQDSGVRMK